MDRGQREWVLERETGRFGGSPKARLTVGLAFPNSYPVAMSNLGYQAVAAIIAGHPEYRLERFFLPPLPGPPSRKVQPTVEGLEAGLQLPEVDLAAFSVSFENDYFGLVDMLRRSGMPVRAADRRHGRWPVILVGGIAPSLNPEPLADIADLFLLGEAEESLPRFLDCFAGAGGGRGRRSGAAVLAALLPEIADLPGLYVPSSARPKFDSEGRFAGYDGAPQFVPPAPVEVDRQPAESKVISPLAHFRSVFLTEVARGCPYRCRFCIVPGDERNYRVRGLRLLLESLERGFTMTDAVGLVGSAVLSHPGIVRLMEEVAGRGGRLGVSSVRLNVVTRKLAEGMAACGMKSVTAAPESASFHLRELIGKPMSDEAIMAGLKHLADAGLERIKLYYMFGFPGETDKDAEAIPAMVSRIRRELPGRTGLTLSLSPFVPKPGTPLEREAMAGRKILKARLEIVRSGLRRIGGVEMKATGVREAMVEAILSRGDRRLGGWLEKADLPAGERFRALEEVGIDPGWINERLEPDCPLPYQFLAGRVANRT